MKENILKEALNHHIVAFLTSHCDPILYKDAHVQHCTNTVRYMSGANLGFFNGIWPHTACDAEIAAHIDYFRKKKLPFCLWVLSDEQKEAQASTLKEFFCPGPFTVIVRDASSSVERIQANDEVVVRKVTTEAMLQDFALVIAKVFFAGSREAYDFYFKTSLHRGFDGPLYHYVSYLNGQAVHAGSLFMTNGIGGLWNGATLSEYRRKGVGSMCAAYHIEEAKKLGAKRITSMLEPDQLAWGYCKKLGFEKCYELHPYFMTHQVAKPEVMS